MESMGLVISRVLLNSERVAVKTLVNNPFGSTIDALSTLGNDLNAATTTINGAQLGPFNLSGYCEYDCLWSGFCVYGSNWQITFPGATSQPLQAQLDQTVAVGKQLYKDGAALGIWLNSLAAETSVALIAACNNILSVDTAIVAAGGVATAAQSSALNSAFADIASILSNAQESASTTVEAISDDVQNLAAAVSELSQVLQLQQSQVTTWINTSWPSLCGSLSCGQGDATNQLNSALGNLNTTFASINTAVSTLQIDVVALTTACESLTDALLVVSDQFSLVAGQIADSKGYPAGAIAKLHLDIAMSEWNQLQQYVEQNLT
jgi:hypothetical protein